jgi:hypothetical protein
MTAHVTSLVGTIATPANDVAVSGNYTPAKILGIAGKVSIEYHYSCCKWAQCRMHKLNSARSSPDGDLLPCKCLACLGDSDSFMHLNCVQFCRIF